MSGNLDAWLVAHAALQPPLQWSLVPAGGSNLTSIVTDGAGRRVVVRRPPSGALLATAHDVAREWKVITALHARSSVPVPEPIAFDGAAPLFVMAFVDGVILRSAADAARFGLTAAGRACDSLIDGLALLHSTDAEAAGLADLGRPDNYCARQLARWLRQYQASKIREVSLLLDLHRRLATRLPIEQGAGAIVHGDYRFDNCVMTPSGDLAAVLDWELSTRGDPVADFWWSLLYWADPGDAFTALPNPPTLAPGFARRDHVAARYAAATGFDLSDRAWYEAFSLWKQAAITEGVYARRRAGIGAGLPTGDIEAIAARADTLLAIADDRLSS